jgi:hypothetical protein
MRQAGRLADRQLVEGPVLDKAVDGSFGHGAYPSRT